MELILPAPRRVALGRRRRAPGRHRRAADGRLGCLAQRGIAARVAARPRKQCAGPALLPREGDVQAVYPQGEAHRRVARARIARAGRRSDHRRRSGRRGQGRRPRTPHRCSSRCCAPGRGRRSPGRRPPGSSSSCTQAHAHDGLDRRRGRVGEHLGPAAALGHLEQQLGRLLAETRLARAGAPSPTKSRRASASNSAGRAGSGT